jgi:hypothetical protein
VLSVAKASRATCSIECSAWDVVVKPVAVMQVHRLVSPLAVPKAVDVVLQLVMADAVHPLVAATNRLADANLAVVACSAKSRAVATDVLNQLVVAKHQLAADVLNQLVVAKHRLAADVLNQLVVAKHRLAANQLVVARRAAACWQSFSHVVAVAVAAHAANRHVAPIQHVDVQHQLAVDVLNPLADAKLQHAADVIPVATAAADVVAAAC